MESLIGPDTVDTVPPKTLDAFRDHGKVAQTLTEDVAGAEMILGEAKALGLDLDGVTAGLVEDGVKLFAKAFDDLFAAVEDKRGKLAGQTSPKTTHA